MVKLIVFIIFTSIAIFVGPMLADTQGFVHIVAGDRIIETSVNTAIVLYLLSILMLFLIYLLLKKILNIPMQISSGLKTRSFHKKLSAQDEAFIDYSQGQYEQSLGLLKHTSSLKKMSEKSLLVAAQAAFHLENYDFTSKALDEASSRGRQAKIAADITRAKLNLDVGNAKVALEYLDGLKNTVRNRYVLKLYYLCYKKQGNLEKILELGKELVKVKIISKEDLRNVYIEQLNKDIKKADSVEALDKIYDSLSRDDKGNSKIMGPIIYKYLKVDKIDKAKNLTLTLLKNEMDPIFIESISNWEVAINDVLIFLKKYAAKNVISSQVNLPLLKAMGNLEFRSGLLPDALEDYKKAVAIGPSPDVYIRIGTILSNMNKPTESTEFYSKANAMIFETKALQILK